MEKIEKYIPLVEELADFVWMKYPHDEAIEKQDLVQEGLIILWRCSKDYDKSYGYSFEEYARNEIFNRMRVFRKQASFPKWSGKGSVKSRFKGGEISVENLEKRVNYRLLLEKIYRWLDKSGFSTRDKAIFLKSIFSRKNSQLNLGKQNKISQSRVERIIRGIRNKIRNKFKEEL